MKKGDILTNNNICYTLIKSIGDGGSGVVWKAQVVDNPIYAIKFINSNDKNKIERFNGELTFCKNNPYKNIVPIIADGEYEEIRYYIMPLYPKTFRDVINEEKNADVLIKYILQLCNAVKFIHKKGIIHRDIKPENILIDGKSLVLADFGIAHFKDSSLTKSKDLLANRNYSAPEQKIRDNAKNIEKSADIFALGLILNECFTKQNPAGSNFKLIKDDYPLYSQLDTLVANMTKQNQNDRFTIDDVIVELKFIYGNIQSKLHDIQEDLRYAEYPKDINQKLLNKIIKQASEDLLFAKILFENKSAEDFRKYNLNWHMKIGYKVDSFLFNLCMQEQLFEICKNKFDYESNNHQIYNSLDLKENEEHNQIFEQMKNFVLQYPLNNEYNRAYDLSGKILKYFSSCKDYHCEEILKIIHGNNFLNSSKEKLFDVPILWIITYLKQTVTENSQFFEKGADYMYGKSLYFDIAEHISIDWDTTQYYVINADQTELFESYILDEEKKVNDILSELKKQWKAIFNKIDNRYYSVKFQNYKHFDKFRQYALQLSKPDYIFEGDVLSLLRNYNYSNGIVEFIWSNVFEIPYVLAKIVGLRQDD